MQQAVVVHDQQIARPELELQLAGRIVDPVGQRLAGAVVAVEQIRIQGFDRIRPVGHAQLAHAPQRIQLDQRTTVLEHRVVIGIPEPGTHPGQRIEGVGIVAPQFLRHVKTVGDRRVATIGIVDQTMQEDVSGHRLPVGIVRVLLERPRGHGEVVGIRDRLDVGYAAPVRPPHWADALDHLGHAVHLDRHVAHEDEGVTTQRLEHGVQGGIVVPCRLPVRFRNLRQVRIPGHDVITFIGPAPQARRQFLDGERCDMAVGEGDVQVLTLFPGLAHRRLQGQRPGVEQPLARLRIAAFAARAALAQPDRMQFVRAQTRHVETQASAGHIDSLRGHRHHSSPVLRANRFPS